MIKRIFISLPLLLVLASWCAPVHATRKFDASQTSPTPAPGSFDMGTAQSVTMNLTNLNTLTNVNERIYEIRVRLTTSCTAPCTLTTFSSTTTAPAGWTRTAFSTSSVTFQATSWNNAISTVASGGPTTSVAFTFALTAGKFTVDTSQTFQDIRARWTNTTTGPPFSRASQQTCSSTATCGSLGSWKAMSLQVTSFQTTDTLGTPVSAIAAGVSFRVVITVKNISTATQNGIAANPSPPTVTKVGTWGGSSPNCSLTGTNPSPLNLAAGVSGTITYTCTTLATDSGTATYSVTNVRNSTSTATSRTGSSNTLSVSPLNMSIAVTPTCLFTGGTATFTMTVTNNTSVTVTNVVPTLNSPTVANGATVGALTGPTLVVASSDPGCSTTLPNTKSCVYTWTATASVTGSYPSSPPQPSFFTTGSASACAGATCPPSTTITTPTATSQPNPKNILEYAVSVSPVTVSASSTNVELDWNMANLGCTDVNSVAITAPAGWVLSTDPSYGYSLVTDTTSTKIDTWTISGTTFTAPSATARVLLNQVDNDYFLLFSAVPSTLGPSTFTIVVTDATGVSRTQTTTVTVNSLTPGSSTPSTWREIFQ